MATTPANSALQKIDAIIERVAKTGERVRVCRRGKQAAIVPVEDLKLIHAIEDYLDLRAVEESRAELRKTGKKLLKWEEVRGRFLKHSGRK
jgi:PHD/YefM family antitoxin component YafN of YafNO toxin-antitoxin module